MSPPSHNEQPLKRKRREDRAVDDEDSKSKKRARKEEKKRAKQATQGEGAAFVGPHTESLNTPTRDASTQRTPRSKSPQHGRRSSQSGVTSKAERKQIHKNANRRRSSYLDLVEHDSVNGSVKSTGKAGASVGEQSVERTAEKLSKKQLKKHRKQRRIIGTAASGGKTRTNDESHVVISDAKVARKKAKREAIDNTRTARKSNLSAQELSWRMSTPTAGRFVDHPAVFSIDENHLLFATEHQIGAYSANTSLLEHEFRSETSGNITSYTLSATNPDVAYVGTRKGYVVSWNWKEGQFNGRWMVGPPIWSLTCARVENFPQDTVFTAEQTDDRWNITAHRFGIDGDPSKTELTTLLKHDRSIRSLRVLGNCEAIVAVTPDSLIVGKLTSGSKQGLKRLAYEWREVPCKEPPTCFDARMSPQKPDALTSQDIDIVFGGLKGALFYYQALFAKIGMENQPTKQISARKAISAPQMHWHREAVGAVAFSRDGSYIISGGRETVLVLWQLDTGRKQFLPHLESPIQTLTVSPTGASYAVGLGDNSVMVLSTAELKPSSNFAGLQTLCTSALPPHQLILPTKEVFEQVTSGTLAPVVQATVNPQRLNDLLCAVPAYQSVRTEIFPDSPTTPYLQTYPLNGLESGSRVAKQALAQTNATNTNLGPEGNRLKESSITCFAISQNGNWLAVVDEWTPPKQDLEDLNIDAADMEEEAVKHRSVTLRIWEWQEAKENSGSWVLNSRINAPHTLDGSRISGRVLALGSRPGGSGFATVGEDCVLRIWRPKTRMPDGRVLWRDTAPMNAEQKASKGFQAKIQTSWTTYHTIALDLPAYDESLKLLHPSRAAMAYSSDGSLIAIHLHHKTVSNALMSTTKTREATVAPDYDDPTNTLVHFVDADFGKVRELRSDMCPATASALAPQSPSAVPFDGIHQLGFLEHQLIAVTRHAAYVWDVTSFTPLSTITLPSPLNFDVKQANDETRADKRNTASIAPPAPILAVNPATQTFAVSAAIPAQASDRAAHAKHGLPPHAHRDYTSRIEVFEMSDVASSSEPKPLLSMPVPRLTLALLNASGSAAIERDSERAADLRDEGRALARQALTRGYHLIDCSATLRSLRPPLARALAVADIDSNTEADFARDTSPAVTDGTAVLARAATQEEDQKDDQVQGGEENDSMLRRQPRPGPVVTAEQLAAVFEPNAAKRLPNLKEMFDGVMRLFASKGAD